jgi:NTE family protein
MKLNRLPLLVIVLALLLLGGCTRHGVIDNPPIRKIDEESGYSWFAWAKTHRIGDIALIVNFSGGGTRAAALAYGVLQGLRDTTIDVDSKPVRVLDEVDYISSVSGGSFTSAYYGLYRDQIFEDFEQDFLLRDVEGHLIWGIFNPMEWFRKGGRTEMAIRYYNKHIFHDATFTDINLKDGPLILINSSDLAHGVRFSFIQDYFNLLCSDLSNFPVARAVTASSAVPLVFLPVVLENYPECDTSNLQWLSAARKRAGSDPQLDQMVGGIESLLDKDKRRYIHMVDGAITDNLGLRAYYDMVTLAGGPEATIHREHHKPPKHLVIISVDASTDYDISMDKSKAEPSLEETVGAISDVLMYRYNTSSEELLEEKLRQWAKAISTPAHEVKPHYIRIGADEIRKGKDRQAFDKIPTNFSLNQEQVDLLVNTGRTLLQNNPHYQQLVTELDSSIARKQ